MSSSERDADGSAAEPFDDEEAALDDVETMSSSSRLSGNDGSSSSSSAGPKKTQVAAAVSSRKQGAGKKNGGKKGAEQGKQDKGEKKEKKEKKDETKKEVPLTVTQRRERRSSAVRINYSDQLALSDSEEMSLGLPSDNSDGDNDDVSVVSMADLVSDESMDDAESEDFADELRQSDDEDFDTGRQNATKRTTKIRNPSPSPGTAKAGAKSKVKPKKSEATSAKPKAVPKRAAAKPRIQHKPSASTSPEQPSSSTLNLAETVDFNSVAAETAMVDCLSVGQSIKPAAESPLRKDNPASRSKPSPKPRAKKRKSEEFESRTSKVSTEEGAASEYDTPSPVLKKIKTKTSVVMSASVMKGDVVPLGKVKGIEATTNVKKTAVEPLATFKQAHSMGAVKPSVKKQAFPSSSSNTAKSLIKPKIGGFKFSVPYKK